MKARSEENLPGRQGLEGHEEALGHRVSDILAGILQQLWM